MPEREARVFAEGSLRWAQASGSGLSWATASAAATGLLGFVQAGMSINSARDMLAVYDRGLPSHHKWMQSTMPEVTFTFLQAVTASMPPLAPTASGASVPMLHFEMKHDIDEIPGSAHFWQFVGGVCLSNGFTENREGNTIQQTWRFLSYTGPTASGYLATGGQ
jgi:hypothetical protein